VDAAANQANRPEKKIELPPVLITNRLPQFLDGEALLRGEYRGCGFHYERSSNETYQEAESWFDKRGTKRPPEAIIAAINQRVKEKRSKSQPSR